MSQQLKTMTRKDGKDKGYANTIHNGTNNLTIADIFRYVLFNKPIKTRLLIMGKARIKIDNNLLDKPRSSWEHIIDEYIKNEDDRYIATRYYLDGISQLDIAEELVGENDKPKSASYMKRHIAKIRQTILKHKSEL